MNPNWTQLKELFSLALELEPQDRLAFVNKACGDDEDKRAEVLALLSAHDAAGDFLQRPALVDVGLLASDETASIGQQIGSYRIVRELGRGGMGAVYLAARVDETYEKLVALKLIKRGMDSDAIIKRFVMERRILANLDHQNIARLIDGGTTEDGRPYFVLDYIEGTTITSYCDHHKLNTLERLKLFRQVCAGVQFAHQNLVVHRDLKPSNIIVTKEGTPKLLDFGIAKLLSGPTPVEATSTIGRALTPEYTSPEELRGLPVTTSTDVYSLGVVLYELLSGHRPFNFENRSPDEVARKITASSPLKPSAVITHTENIHQTGATEAQTPEAVARTREGNIEKLRRRLAGDLDNILLKALRREPERRYASVQEFSDDLRRHLEGLPVQARPDTLSYRASKFIIRHKGGVAAAAIVLLTLVSATLVTGWQARVARRERDKAERRFNQVRTLANSVLFEYHDGIEKLPGSTPVRQKMVRDALEYLDNLSLESDGDLTLQAELATAYEKVGDVQGNPYGPNLGNQEGALASYRKALAIREVLFTASRADHRKEFELADSFRRVADILWAKGQNEEALSNYRKASVHFEELVQTDPKNPQYVRGFNLALNGFAHVQTQTGDFKGALDSYQRCLSNAEVLAAADANNNLNIRSVASSSLKVGDALMDLGDYAGALSQYEKSVEGFSRLASVVQNNASTARELGLSYARIASTYAHLKRYDRAVEFHLKAIERQKQMVATDPNNMQSNFDIAATYGNLGDSYFRIKKLDAAVASVREAIRILTSALSRNPDYVQGKCNLAVGYETFAEILLARGDANAALENFRKALNLLEHEPVRGAQTSSLARSYEGVGDVQLLRANQVSGQTQQRRERLQEASNSYQKAFDVWHGLDRQGKVSGEDGVRSTEVTQKLEQCRVALAKVKTTP